MRNQCHSRHIIDIIDAAMPELVILSGMNDCRIILMITVIFGELFIYRDDLWRIVPLYFHAR